jgi:hypothetical protein
MPVSLAPCFKARGFTVLFLLSSLTACLFVADHCNNHIQIATFTTILSAQLLRHDLLIRRKRLA